MPQNYNDLMNESVTPAEFISKSGNGVDITFARTVLGSMKFTPMEAEHSVTELSGGQKAKVFFIKMIIDKCNVLILDEPTRNLSVLSVPVICDVLSEYKGCLLYTSADITVADEV